MCRYSSGVLRAFASTLVLLLAGSSAWATRQEQPDRSANAGPALSSSFPGPLWNVVAPLGGSATVANQHLFLKVPGGSNHDALRPRNQAVRVEQAVGNEDFDVSIKIDSQMMATDAETSQGLMVLADDENFFTFALATDGTHVSLGVSSVSAGTATTVFNNASFTEYQSPMYLRLNRMGSAYIAYYSVDGVVWTQATSFNDARVPAFLGPFAGNYNGTPARAVPVVMAINWFDVL